MLEGGDAAWTDGRGAVPGVADSEVATRQRPRPGHLQSGVDVVMSPDQSFVALQEAAERKKLDEIDATLLPADRFGCRLPDSPAAVAAAAAA